MNIKKEVDKALNVLEEYIIKEMDKIREMIDQQSKTKDLFSIINYSEVCKELKEKEEICPYKKIKQIEKLFNGTWVKDLANRSQLKYYPYFEYNNSGGLVFDDSVSHSYYSDGQVAFYKDKLTSDFVGKTFIDIYKEIN